MINAVSPEFFSCLGSDDWVLDLGSRGGSFPLALTEARVIRVDREAPAQSAPNFVCADAARLPLADRSIRAVVANHSLEHFTELDSCLAEIGRVLADRGVLYVAVPDASTLTDKLYRWLGNGGGHVHQFVNAAALARQITALTGLELKDQQVLYSGFSFLNRANSMAALPLRILLVGGGFEWTLQLGTYLLRKIDGLFRTRLSMYGWAFYFGEEAPPRTIRTENQRLCPVRIESQRELVARLRPRQRFAALAALSLPILRGAESVHQRQIIMDACELQF